MSKNPQKHYYFTLRLLKIIKIKTIMVDYLHFDYVARVPLRENK